MPYVVPLRQGHPVQSLHRLPPNRHPAHAPSPGADRPRSCCRVLEAAARDSTAGSLTGRPDAASQMTAGNLSPNPARPMTTALPPAANTPPKARRQCIAKSPPEHVKNSSESGGPCVPAGQACDQNGADAAAESPFGGFCRPRHTAHQCVTAQGGAGWQMGMTVALNRLIIRHIRPDTFRGQIYHPRGVAGWQAGMTAARSRLVRHIRRDTSRARYTRADIKACRHERFTQLSRWVHAYASSSDLDSLRQPALPPPNTLHLPSPPPLARLACLADWHAAASTDRRCQTRRRARAAISRPRPPPTTLAAPLDVADQAAATAARLPAARPFLCSQPSCRCDEDAALPSGRPLDYQGPASL
jgi:hypothetical protein